MRKSTRFPVAAAIAVAIALFAVGCESELSDEDILDGIDCEAPLETVLDDGSTADVCELSGDVEEDEFGFSGVATVRANRCLSNRECKTVACPSAYYASRLSCRASGGDKITRCYCYYN